MNILSIFYPDAYTEDIFAFPESEWLKWRDKGIKAVMFDIDNTLVPHGAPADLRSAELLSGLRSLGFKTMLLSNNGEARVKPFARSVGAEYIYKAGKPSVKAYRRACQKLGLKPSEVLFVGDQIFTDVMGAKRAGLPSLLSEPIDRSTDIFKIRLKRIPEGIIVSSFKKRGFA